MAEAGRPGGPLLVELDAGTQEAHRAAVAPWLGTVSVLQQSYERLLRRTVAQVSDPLVRTWLDGVATSAREHARAVDELYAAFDLRRPPARVLPAVGAALLGRARRVVGRWEGRVAGASSGVWADLRQLQLANLDAMSAFAVAQQLGLALGRPQVVEVAFGVVAKKSEQQLLLQELFLELSTDALLARP